MRSIFTHSTFAFVIATLIVVIHIGCGFGVLKQNREVASAAKLQESTFIVVNTTDVKNPMIAGSVQLPFRIHQNNTVVLSGTQAYVTTESHLHVIDISNRQQPSYRTSLAFSDDDIGKVRVFGHQVYVQGRYKLYIVDVSNPTQPALQSTVRLDHRNKIKDFDVQKSYPDIYQSYQEVSNNGSIIGIAM